MNISATIQFLSLLTLLSNVFLSVLIIYLILRRLIKISAAEKAFDFFRDQAPYFALAVALTATLGSLFFSEIAKFTPCELCWFQRICMYPQVAVLAVGVIFRDAKVGRYIIPLCLIGGVFSAYQYYLQLFPPPLAVCSADGDCTANFFRHYGYINIAFMALSASALNFTLMLLPKRKRNGEERPELS